MRFTEPDPHNEKVKAASFETSFLHGFGHLLYQDNVMSVLRGEAEPAFDERQGLTSLEVLVADCISARHARRMSLPLDY